MSIETCVPSDILMSVESKIQTDLNIKDSKYLNAGPLSTLVFTLSNVLFDAKQFNETMIREYNVATAQDLKSMLFHSSIYGYTINLATPACVSGYLVIPAPKLSDNSELKINIKNYSSINISGIYFRIDGEINITIDSNGKIEANIINNKISDDLECLETNEDSKKYYLVKIGEEYLTQLNRKVVKNIVPAYEIGENIAFTTDFDKMKIYQAKAFVNKSGNPSFDISKIEYMSLDDISIKFPELEEIKMKTFKFDSLPNEYAIFADYSDDFEKMKYTLGNGIYGTKFDTNDEIIIVLDLTTGLDGNIDVSSGTISNILFYVINSETGDTISVYQDSLSFVTDKPAINGRNVESIDDIRFNILKSFTQRNSLITILDYQKYFQVLGCNVAVINRQIDTMNPLVSIYTVFRDPYTSKIIDTLTLNLKDDELKDDKIRINITETYNQEEFISPYIFTYSNNAVSMYWYLSDYEIPFVIKNIYEDYQEQVSIKIKFNDDKFYFEGSELSEGYYYEFIVDGKTYRLDSSNNWTQVIKNDNYFIEYYPLDSLNFDDVNVYNDNNSLIRVLTVIDNITILQRIQTLKYYKRSDGSDYIMYVPFIKKDYYDKYIDDNKVHESYKNNFLVNQALATGQVPFNITLNQVFYNTVDIDPEIANHGILINDNENLVTKMPIKINIIYDTDQMNMQGIIYDVFTNEIKIAIVNYLIENENYAIRYYAADLIKYIKNLFSDIVVDMKLMTPLTLGVEDVLVVYNNIIPIEENYDKILDFTPSYFFFDYDNIELNFFEKTLI